MQRLSRTLWPTLKEVPSDADNPSARLMLRAGLTRKVAAGLYEWLPMGLRVLRRVEQVVREEMNRAGGQEVWLPILQPRELWEETGRWQVYGKELMRVKDRKEGEFCLAPTAEEVITDLVRREVRSYRELPQILYQFGVKFRDEIRPRFGVMRAREFYMKDAYSFHATEESLAATYRDVFAAYQRIFTRLGLRFRPVEADTGAIGGHFSHEFMVLADTGEETLAACPKEACGYAANVERAEAAPRPAPPTPASPSPAEEVATPGQTSVEDVARALGVTPAEVIKMLLYVADGKPVAALLRGDTNLNELKWQRLLGAKTLYPAPEEVYRRVSGGGLGFMGPRGLAEPVDIWADDLVRALGQAVTGANKTDTHLTHMVPERDFQVKTYGDLRKAEPGDCCPRCGAAMDFLKGIEVGHTFQLGTRYSKAMSAGFLPEAGAKTPFVMGCYGIGVSRVVAAAIEQGHDDLGIRWPEPLSPYDVLVLPLNVTDENVRRTAEEIASALEAAGREVLLDDRDQRAGVKFKDADLLGIPWRVVVGERGLAQGQVEVRRRGEETAHLQSPNPKELVDFLVNSHHT